MVDKEQQDVCKLPAVAGYFNGLFTRDIDGAMAAVIVNPEASHSQRLAWALGQLELIKVIAEAADPNDGGERGSPLAYAVRQLIEQSIAVVEGVVREMERRPLEIQPQPLRIV
jgi:hypothetical protein